MPIVPYIRYEVRLHVETCKTSSATSALNKQSDEEEGWR